MHNFETMRKSLQAAIEVVDNLELKWQELNAERKRLEKLEMNDASPYWHAEKYLYLIHRTVDGYRPRKYIGRKEAKVKDALESIQRFQQHKALCDELNQLKIRLMDAQFQLQQFTNRINGRGR